ncbi:MAG: hypothetical protein LBK52_01040, partial [Deltaproteobacteria bacterium]|nr:hypothetical protein [Deltaproteobacteria bacterium]
MTAALDPSRQIAGICREVLKLYDQSLRLASSDPQKLQKEARIQSQMAFKLLAARSPLEELARSREAGSAVRLREAALDLLKACLKAKLPKEAKHILDNCLSGTAAGSLVSPDRRRLLRDLIEGFLEAGLIREAEELFWSLEMPEPGSQEVRPAGLLYLAFIILYGLRKRPELASVIYN